VKKFVSDLRQVGSFLQLFRFPQPIKLTEILLKVVLNTIIVVYCVCHKPGPGFPMSHVLVFLCSARRWFFILFILVELFKLSFHSRRVLGAVCTEIICYIYLFNQCLLLLKVVNLISFIFPPYKKDLTKTRIIFPRMISDWNRLPQPP
jgi:hypothetical protein